MAGRQFGRIRYDQIRTCGASARTIGRWRRAGYIHRVLPRVYAVGHTAPGVESDLAAALLYAGPGAALAAGTALWWLELLKYPPGRIFVATPRRIRDLDGIVVLRERGTPRATHHTLPTTTVSQALLDFAATGPPKHLLRLALANADYRDILDTRELERLTGRGVPGSGAISDALRIHLPELARTRSELEAALLDLCRTHKLPLPEPNVYVHGHLVDALWPDRKLIVEIDGLKGHRTRAQLERDHQRDMELRAAGYVVLRYTSHQLTETPAAIAAELASHLL